VLKGKDIFSDSLVDQNLKLEKNTKDNN